MRQQDPVEAIVAAALDAAGVAYERDDGTKPGRLDFYLPAFGVHIECKRFHSPRITEQMARAENVIAIQGIEAARAFAQLVARGR